VPDREITTSAYIREDVEMDGQRSHATGKQRFIKHTSTPAQGQSVSWEHPEPFMMTCQACVENMQALGGHDAFAQLMAEEAPLE
jgi:hypothetical protein